MNASMTIHFAPVIDLPVLAALLLAGAVLLLLSAFLYRRGFWWRLLCLVVFTLFLCNPSFVEEQREAVPDVALAILDRSPSQHYGERTARTDRARAYIEQTLGAREDIELRVIEAPPGDAPLLRETRLFGAVADAYEDVPVARRAGVILLTDGQVHDLPPEGQYDADRFGPLHTLLSGTKDEKDRRLVILEAPAYGIVGQDITIRYRIEDTDNIGYSTARLHVRANGQDLAEQIPVNEDQAIRLPITHGGQNIFDFKVEDVDGELTTANNRAAIIANGIRERLRVLLVSGQPHAGGRTWRDMLTSDPGVDLVHFTILREPDKLDATPQNELSLIAFPFRELFETKLYDFDLIIFDRYRLNRILPEFYFSNIVQYVRNGGALLEASGPSFAGADSIYNTDLSMILPGMPTGEVLETPFLPTLTDAGRRHPVTQNLQGAGGDPAWGKWLRQIPLNVQAGDILMRGAQDNPLLILNRVGEGRVAHLASDQIWLWSRHYDGGGPHADLLRRLSHWLMKEPELEENALNVTANGATLSIRRHILEDAPLQVEITAPDGTISNETLNNVGDGVLGADITVDQLGIYTVDDGTQQRFAIIGDINPPELQGVVTTEHLLKPMSDASRGRIIWLEDTPEPAIRILSGGRQYGGHGWIGLRHSSGYKVSGVRAHPLMPAWAWASLLLAVMVCAWWMEGRGLKKSAP